MGVMDFLKDLDAIIQQRFEERPEGSYSTSLFEGGLDRILRKVGEETGEVIIAAKNNDPEELTNESADLLYHVMLLLRQQGLSLSDVVACLEQRHR